MADDKNSNASASPEALEQIELLTRLIGVIPALVGKPLEVTISFQLSESADLNEATWGAIHTLLHQAKARAGVAVIAAGPCQDGPCTPVPPVPPFQPSSVPEHEPDVLPPADAPPADVSEGP